MDKILIIDEEFPEHEIEKKILAEQLPTYKIIEADYNLKNVTEEDLKDTLGILAQVYANINSKLIDSMPRLKGISVSGGGYNRIDVKYANAKNIMVSRVPDYSNDEVAEFVITAMLMHAKNINMVTKAFYNDAWGYLALIKHLSKIKKRNVGIEDLPTRLSGKTLLIVGFGKIGRGVAEKAHGLGMKIIFYDAFVPDSYDYAKKVSFEEGIKLADYISIHTPLKEDTKGMFHYDIFKMMKKSAYIINTARGEIIKEDDLIRALKSHLIAGAALDVFENEPIDTSRKILKLKSVLATPHCIYVSDESIRRLKKEAAENLIKMVTGQVPKDIIKI